MVMRNRSVQVHNFAMIPRADIPRSSFRMQRAYKTTFGGISGTGVQTDASWLFPVLCEEVLPGDTWNCKMTALCRLATPIFPAMDNLYLDSFFFFVPNRLVWDNWHRFMGERDPDTDSSIDYLVPVVESPVGGYKVNSLGDYFGLPTEGQIGAESTFEHSALPFRAYNLIWNEWFRDENLMDKAQVPRGDGPDDPSLYPLRWRAKRHDYFTSCLPWPQKGESIALPLGTYAPVISNEGLRVFPGSDVIGKGVPRIAGAANVGFAPGILQAGQAGATVPIEGAFQSSVIDSGLVKWGADPDDSTVGLAADLSQATAATINQLRQSFQIQRLLERDARGGTRYTEILRAHFGVVSPDGRLQRPEYLGGGTTAVQLHAVAQTSATSAEGTDTPQGKLSAFGTAIMRPHGFTQSFTEHGYVIGLVSVRADLTYQQGLRRHWSRQTRYDYYFPVFAHLGEQAVLGKEIYCTGSPGDGGDDDVFGYQERWAEYRYSPSEITGQFRSYFAQPLDAWHYSQFFTSRPVLNEAFMIEAPPLRRNLAVGAAANGQQFLFDAFFDIRAARPLPMYSVPGLIDHF